MKEAIGTTSVFNLVIIFTGVFIALYVGSLAYTKGFKIRNRIIDIIEANGGVTETAKTSIDENLSSIGYQIITLECADRTGADKIDTESAYNYCLYSYGTSKGTYYGVTVFLQFNVPLIPGGIRIPIYGETRIMFNKGGIEG